MKLLHVDSSVLGEASISRRVSAAIVARLAEAHPGVETVRRDLGAAPLAHIGAGLVAATRGPGAGAPPPPEVASDFAVLEEFLAADIVVVGAPMYNFGISSLLKAWIDRIVVPGRTFAYVDGARKGLAGGRRVVVASSRGGLYTEGPFAAYDHQETYLRSVFGFIGITDLAFVRAEGLARPALRDDAIAAALAEAGAVAA